MHLQFLLLTASALDTLGPLAASACFKSPIGDLLRSPPCENVASFAATVDFSGCDAATRQALRRSSTASAPRSFPTPSRDIRQGAVCRPPSGAQSHF